jgi:hypothetical protein
MMHSFKSVRIAPKTSGREMNKRNPRGLRDEPAIHSDNRAYALYRRPRILFMDEGTAHLDLENERYANESLRPLSNTRVSVAHRPDISARAARIFR